MNDLSPPPPLPHPGDGDTPAPVDRIDELLSAMVDGEISPSELVELEEAAVASNTTVQEMAAPFLEGQALAAGSVLDLRSPPSLRHLQLKNALDQLKQPEVASLAGARATLADKQHHQRRRMQRLSSFAAALVVVAGIGIIGSQLGGSGSDSASSSEGGATSTLSRELSDDFAAGDAATDDGASDDAEMLATAEAPQNSAVESGLDSSDLTFFYRVQEAEEGIRPDQLGQEVLAGRIEVSPVDVDAALAGPNPTAANEDSTEGEIDLTRAVASARCIETAFTLQNSNDIPEIAGLALVVLDGQTYELYQFSDDSFAVFDQATCSRVD